MVQKAKSIVIKILVILFFSVGIVFLFSNILNAESNFLNLFFEGTEISLNTLTAPTGVKSVTLYLEGSSSNNAKKQTLTATDGKFTSVEEFMVNASMLRKQSNVFCINEGMAFPGYRTCYEQFYFSIKEGKVYFSFDGMAPVEYNGNYTANGSCERFKF